MRFLRKKAIEKNILYTQSIACAFGLAAAAPRSPYRHLELCGIAVAFRRALRSKQRCGLPKKTAPYPLRGKVPCENMWV